MGSVKCNFQGRDPNAYGKPWGARLSWNGKKLEYDFSSCEVTGELSEGPCVIIQAEPGAPVCFGQKEKYTGRSSKMFAIVGAKFGLDACTFQEALACAKKWYYEYGYGTKLPYRKRKDPEPKKVEELIEEKTQEESEQEEEETKPERLAILDLRSGLFTMGDPDFIHEPNEVGFDNKITMMQTILKQVRNRAGSIKNKNYRDVGCFVMIEPEKVKGAEVLLKRAQNSNEIKEIIIKFN